MLLCFSKPSDGGPLQVGVCCCFVFPSRHKEARYRSLCVSLLCFPKPFNGGPPQVTICCCFVFLSRLMEARWRLPRVVALFSQAVLRRPATSCCVLLLCFSKPCNGGPLQVAVFCCFVFPSRLMEVRYRLLCALALFSQAV